MAFAKAAQAPLKLIDFLASGFDGELLILMMAFYCRLKIRYPYTLIFHKL